MAAAIALRGDCDSGLLRELAKQSEDADQVRRLLALAVVYDGGSRSDGARAGGVVCRPFGTGFCGSTPPARRGWWTARRHVRRLGSIRRSATNWRD